MNTLNWYVAYTYPKFEKKVNTRFQQYGYETFLPLHTVRRVWSDRIKMVELPLFPNYLFVKTRKENLSLLQDFNGVVKFVSFQNEFAKVREKEIKLIKQLIGNGKDLKVERNQLFKGQQVRVKSGPLLGLKGLLVREEGKKRFLLEINDLKQKLSVSIPTHLLEPIGIRSTRMVEQAFS